MRHSGRKRWAGGLVAGALFATLVVAAPTSAAATAGRSPGRCGCRSPSATTRPPRHSIQGRNMAGDAAVSRFLLGTPAGRR
jgi:hypothetical protein